MIQKINISGIHVDLEQDIKKYAVKKIGKLDRFVPRHARKTAFAEIKLKESSIKTKKQLTCEVILRLPKETITVKETTLNMFASIDVVETRLKNLLKKYKDKHTQHSVPRRLLERVKRRSN